MSRRNQAILFSITVTAGAFLAAADHAAAQADDRTRPMLRTQFHVLTHLEWRKTGETEPGDGLDVRRARLGLEGVIFRRVEYEVERDFRREERPWRDAYVNVPLRHALEVTAGRFKVPFSREQLTGVKRLDLVQRSLAATYLAPGRDIGLMVHGRLLGRLVRYQAGAFRTGGDNVRPSERHHPKHGGLVAGRIVFRPWSAGLLRDLSVGASITTGPVPEGEFSLRGHTAADVPFFPVVVVHGERRRYGAEVEWREGPLGIAGEAMHVADERRGQAIDDGPLSDVMANGWYVSGTWLVTGEEKDDRIRPARPLLRGGIGAVELAARLEHLEYGSRASGEAAAWIPRAEVLPVQGDRVWTLGVNWYAHTLVKIQANVVREWRRDARRPIGASEWYPLLRVQFSL